MQAPPWPCYKQVSTVAAIVSNRFSHDRLAATFPAPSRLIWRVSPAALTGPADSAIKRERGQFPGDVLMCSQSGNNRILKSLALVLALTAVFAFAPSFGMAQNAGRKLSVQDIVNLLTGDVPSDEVAKEARKAGISFQVTSAVVKQIKDAGGTDDLIQELRDLAPRGAPPLTPPPIPHPVPAASPPTLVIVSTPGQSQVYVDDEPVGSTSQQGRLRLTQLAAGQHSVRVSQSGYQESEQTVTLEPGRVTTVSATLQRIEAPPPTPEPIPQPPTPEPEPAEPPRVSQPGYLGVLPAQQQPQGARGVVISGT